MDKQKEWNVKVTYKAHSRYGEKGVGVFNQQEGNCHVRFKNGDEEILKSSQVEATTAKACPAKFGGAE